jgi:hypothetical protein
MADQSPKAVSPNRQSPAPGRRSAPARGHPVRGAIDLLDRHKRNPYPVCWSNPCRRHPVRGASGLPSGTPSEGCRYYLPLIASRYGSRRVVVKSILTIRTVGRTPCAEGDGGLSRAIGAQTLIQVTMYGSECEGGTSEDRYGHALCHLPLPANQQCIRVVPTTIEEGFTPRRLRRSAANSSRAQRGSRSVHGHCLHGHSPEAPARNWHPYSWLLAIPLPSGTLLAKRRYCPAALHAHQSGPARPALNERSKHAQRTLLRKFNIWPRSGHPSFIG